MANNSIALITKYSTKGWDKVYKAEACSSLLDAPEAQVKFTGAKTVKIAKFSAGGLGNYYRNNDGDDRLNQGTPFGYASSNVGLTWEEFTLRQDRSAKYPIELFDNEETDGLTLGAATTEISRTIMVPEVDAYCFSTIAGYCSATLGNLVAGHGGSDITDSNALAALNDGLLYFDNYEVPAEKQIIFARPKYINLLRNDRTELARYLMQGDYNKDVKFRMTSYEGRKFVMVPPNRFKTDIVLGNNGYTWGQNSKEINFMIVSTDAVLHVVKYNKVKILSGDMVLAGMNYDGYAIFARIYHDVFVPDNKRFGIYTNVAVNNDNTGATKLDIKLVDGKIAGITVYPGEKLYKFVTSTDTLAVGDNATNTTKVNIGSAVAANTKVYAVGDDGKVAAIFTA